MPRAQAASRPARQRPRSRRRRGTQRRRRGTPRRSCPASRRRRAPSRRGTWCPRTLLAERGRGSSGVTRRCSVDRCSSPMSRRRARRRETVRARRRSRPSLRAWRPSCSREQRPRQLHPCSRRRRREGRPRAPGRRRRSGRAMSCGRVGSRLTLEPGAEQPVDETSPSSARMPRGPQRAGLRARSVRRLRSLPRRRARRTTAHRGTGATPPPRPRVPPAPSAASTSCPARPARISSAMYSGSNIRLVGHDAIGRSELLRVRHRQIDRAYAEPRSPGPRAGRERDATASGGRRSRSRATRTRARRQSRAPCQPLPSRRIAPRSAGQGSSASRSRRVRPR